MASNPLLDAVQNYRYTGFTPQYSNAAPPANYATVERKLGGADMTPEESQLLAGAGSRTGAYGWVRPPGSDTFQFTHYTWEPQAASSQAAQAKDFATQQGVALFGPDLGQKAAAEALDFASKPYGETQYDLGPMFNEIYGKDQAGNYLTKGEVIARLAPGSFQPSYGNVAAAEHARRKQAAADVKGWNPANPWESAISEYAWNVAHGYQQ